MKNIFDSTKRSLRFIAYSLFAVAMTACSSSDDPDEPDLSRTVLVYMVANNNLGTDGWADRDLSEMMEAAADGELGNGRLLVYRNVGGSTPDRLVEILPDSTMNVLVTYNDDNLSAVDAERMKRVIADTRRIAPASSNGIVLWSHGTGWIEEESSRGDGPQRSFGLDGRKRMKITSLADALRQTPFDWIYFDCCHMGTAEIIYELRDAAPAIVASTTELPLEGMPYNVNIGRLFATPADLVGAARNTYNYYLNYPEATTQSCAIAVYDTGAFDALAAASRSIMELGLDLPDDYWPISYGRFSLSSTIYDMPHYYKALGAPASLMQAWDKAYRDAVIFYAATPKSYGIDMSNFTGLGCMIISSPNQVSKGYDSYKWFKDVVSHNPRLN